MSGDPRESEQLGPTDTLCQFRASDCNSRKAPKIRQVEVSRKIMFCSLENTNLENTAEYRQEKNYQIHYSLSID